MMIHCGEPISYASIETNYWQQHFYCFGRIPKVAGKEDIIGVPN
jgi:hypothetical protein